MNLYFHVPFCRGKCDYCAFYSEGAFSLAEQEAWLNKIAKDLESFSCDDPVETLYIGGGTPTALNEQILSRFLNLLHGRFRFAADAEISSECNPGSLTPQKAEILAGFVNRISMGVQSFHPETLEQLGRRSAPPETVASTLHLLRENGIANIGLDLIYAVPGIPFSSWQDDLKRAVDCEPEHISAYALSIEPGTPLAARFPETDLPDEDFQADCWELAGTLLKNAGLFRYEISNYARPGFECRHNCHVWHGESYYAFGPSACSFNGTDRWTEASPLRKWLAGVPAERDVIPQEARQREVFIMGLRTVRGWNRSEFDWTPFIDSLKILSGDGLLELAENTCRPTERGLLCWNSIAEALIL